MNNMLQIIPMPMPINTSGGGASIEILYALLIVLGALVFVPSLIWLIISFVKAKRTRDKTFDDWWFWDAPIVAKLCVGVYLGAVILCIVIWLALKIAPLL